MKSLSLLFAQPKPLDAQALLEVRSLVEQTLTDAGFDVHGAGMRMQYPPKADISFEHNQRKFKVDLQEVCL